MEKLLLTDNFKCENSIEDFTVDLKTETDTDLDYGNSSADFKINIKEEITSTSQNIAAENEYEEFVCKNEEVYLKSDHDEDPQTER